MGLHDQIWLGYFEYAPIFKFKFSITVAYLIQWIYLVFGPQKNGKEII